MTRKHYELIAGTLRTFGEEHRSDRAATELTAALAAQLATDLKATNPRFDRGRFLAACEPVRPAGQEQL